VHKRERTVSRAYGGSRCGSCVRSRWVMREGGREGEEDGTLKRRDE